MVRLGKARGLKVYIFLFALAYFSIIVLFMLTCNPFWLLSFFSLPFVFQAVRTACSFYDDITSFIPSNANTLLVYQLNGLAMLISALIHRFL